MVGSSRLYFVGCGSTAVVVPLVFVSAHKMVGFNLVGSSIFSGCVFNYSLEMHGKVHGH